MENVLKKTGEPLNREDRETFPSQPDDQISNSKNVLLKVLLLGNSR
jgi:hypothetical protein